MRHAAAIFCLTACFHAHANELRDGPNGHKLILINALDTQVGEKGFAKNPLRNIHLATYWIADTETTVEQFAAFVKATNYVTDAERLKFGRVAKEGMADWAWISVEGACWRFPHGPAQPAAENNHPVTQISGADARAYAAWIGGCLPSIDEWEIAASAGSTTRYPWGDKFDAKKANIWNGESHRKNTREDGFLFTSPVRSFPPNKWGLYDVIGNVFEYCEGIPNELTIKKTTRDQVIAGRGGSWWCSSTTCSYYNLRDVGTMSVHGSIANQGFRMVFDEKAVLQKK